jgi:hypothetical protein
VSTRSTSSPQATPGADAPRTATVLAGRFAQQAGRILRHEWTIAALACVALAALLNRGAFADLSHTLPRDPWDPSLNAYLIAWGGYALLHQPLNLFDLNAFYPSPYGLAYSDVLLAYAPFATIGTGPEAAVARYNLLFIGAQALVHFGGYVLARQLGLRPAAAALVGVAVALAPWRLPQAGHIQVLSSGGALLALAMLARGHGIRWIRRGSASADPAAKHRRSFADAATKASRNAETPYRPGWVIAGWLVATWQICVGFGIGIPFLYVLLGCMIGGSAVWYVRRRPLPPRRVLIADGVGGLLFAAIALLLAQPYLRVLELYPYARRDRAWIDLYSPPLSGLFTAPAESHLWGEAHTAAREGLLIANEMAILPGFALYALAAIGVFFSVWPLAVRVGLTIGTLSFLAFSLGTNGPFDGNIGYVLLMNLPGFEGIRTPGRLISWATLLLALLAGGAVGALGRAVHRQFAGRDEDQAVRPALAMPGRTALVGVVLAVPAMVVGIEGLGSVPNARVGSAPPILSTVEAPYLVLPTHEVMDMNVMLWSTDRFADLVNGGSGLVPAELDQTRKVLETFPDEASVDYLRDLGVRTVVVFPYRMGGTPLQEAATMPIDGLGLTREVHPDSVVFTIEP